MRHYVKALPHIITICNAALFSTTAYSSGQDSTGFKLEEIVITAQRREQYLQDTPIAISVLTDQQLLQQGVSSLGDLLAGTVSSLSAGPFSNTKSTLALAIRGNGPGDIGLISRDPSVAVYLDEIYLARAQGLDFELAELERIEILRGPQGTLYGRNATAGAINLISKRPTGEFGIRQTVGIGNYDLISSNTHIDLPKWAGISSKIDYLHTERDGWVNNTAPGESDYNEFDKQGLRLSADISPTDNLTISYAYTDTDTETTQLYFQLYRDLFGVFGDELSRQSRTRYPIIPLEPTRTEQQLHSITAAWQLSDNLRFVSLSSYRELDDKTRNNWGGAAYFNGIIERVNVEQNQFSQEFRLLGSNKRLEWVAGLYYFKEKTDEAFQQFFTRDLFGFFPNSSPLAPIIPPTTFDIFNGSFSPLRITDTDLESTAIYGQATWTPPILNDKLEITAGIRHTTEDNTGLRTVETTRTRFDASPGEQTDPALTFNYHWTDNVSTYAKWSSAYRSGGINARSPSLTPYDPEQVTSYEVGIKMHDIDNRIVFNAAAFNTEYDGMFLDIFLPSDLTIGDSINAVGTVRVEGAEIDLMMAPLQGLTINLSYTHLTGNIPPQQNPLAGNAVEEFLMTQTPRHAGALTIDYQFARLPIGTLNAHMNITSTSDYHHWQSGGAGHPDGYTLVNARIELAEINIAGDYGSLSFAVWGKNITDEEYIVSSFSLGEAGSNHAFGEPRTAGVEVRYKY